MTGIHIIVILSVDMLFLRLIEFHFMDDIRNNRERRNERQAE
jgi:hypothetical protein